MHLTTLAQTDYNRMTYIDQILQERLTEFYERSRKLTILTGAGLSADSDLLTFLNAFNIFNYALIPHYSK